MPVAFCSCPDVVVVVGVVVVFGAAGVGRVELRNFALGDPDGRDAVQGHRRAGRRLRRRRQQTDAAHSHHVSDTLEESHAKYAPIHGRHDLFFLPFSFRILLLFCSSLVVSLKFGCHHAIAYSMCSGAYSTQLLDEFVDMSMSLFCVVSVLYDVNE